MSRPWQISLEKLIEWQGAFYFYTNVWHAAAFDVDQALAIGERIQYAETALLLNDSDVTRTYAIAVRSPERASGWDAVQHTGLPGERAPDGSPVMPAWMVARVEFPREVGRGGRKWYRCGITTLIWATAGMALAWQAAYGSYVERLAVVQPFLRLPDGAVLPPPAPNAVITTYALRHGTRRRQRPVIG